ncbi:molybdopterin-dependent oxidoreductase [Trinickia diaoshuihuensis]|uniref:molybdopterin-dependent oxidoreductase n=1 Tax=Trinickia diaoshuihuensis TaxID=2292265 RepID=UPI0013C30891|nr:molybdopterin-dependent oxidoreductase [Trinickia diaoshuihuensis]
MFAISHLNLPAVDVSQWRLQVRGLVERALTLDLMQLRRYPPAVLESVHHCAGNPLDPTQPSREAANATWSGVWLRDILDDAGVLPGAEFVWADGLDHGVFAGVAVSYYRKDLPRSRIGHDVMLATGLNGLPLPIEHGAPVRLVVPGFYGTNSVKWLWRITLASERAEGLFTTRLYNDPLPDGGSRPVWAMAPSSLIVSPEPFAKVRGPVRVEGWAWSDPPVAALALSADGGATWTSAEVAVRARREWQRWSVLWHPSRRGRHTLQCRATDAAGETQPCAGARNAMHAVAVDVIET